MKHNKGFTLIELLLFTILFSIILGVLVNLFSVIVDTQMEVESTSAVETDSKFITARLMYDMQRAESISVPATLGSNSSSLTLTIDGDTFQYILQEGNLELREDGVANILNSFRTTVTSISFERVGNVGGKNAIHLTFTTESRNPSAAGEESKTIHTLVGLR